LGENGDILGARTAYCGRKKTKVVNCVWGEKWEIRIPEPGGGGWGGVSEFFPEILGDGKLE